MDKTLHLLIMYTMLVLLFLLLQKGRDDKKSRYLAVYALIEVLTNGIDSITLWGGVSVYDKFPAIAFISKPITLLWVPFFYFYVRTCFSSRFKLKNKHLLHLLPFGLAMSFVLILHGIKGGPTIAGNMFQLGSWEGYTLFIIDYTVRLQYILYNVYLILQLLKIEKKRVQNENVPDLNVNIKWLRYIVYSYAFACMGAIVTYILFFFNWEIAIKVNFISILYFFLFFFTIFYDTIVPKPFSSILKVKKAQVPESELNSIMKRLQALLIKNPLYLDANLSLKQITQELDEKERNISLAINTIANRNFKDYINELRVEYAVKQLSSHPDKPIFEVMYESGFNTKWPFYSAFKKFTGKTPSEYRNSLD